MALKDGSKTSEWKSMWVVIGLACVAPVATYLAQADTSNLWAVILGCIAVIGGVVAKYTGVRGEVKKAESLAANKDTTKNP